MLLTGVCGRQPMRCWSDPPLNVRHALVATYPERQMVTGEHPAGCCQVRVWWLRKEVKRHPDDGPIRIGQIGNQTAMQGCHHALRVVHSKVGTLLPHFIIRGDSRTRGANPHKFRTISVSSIRPTPHELWHFGTCCLLPLWRQPQSRCSRQRPTLLYHRWRLPCWNRFYPMDCMFFTSK